MSASLMKIVADMKVQIAALEAALSVAGGAVAAVTEKKRTKKEPGPKKEMSAGMKKWHEFNTRIDTLLKANDMKFKRVAEAKQFASKLKKMREEWNDEDILAERRTWAEEHKPVCAVCSEDATTEPSTHDKCMASFVENFMAEQKGTKEEGMTEWLKLSGLSMPKADSDNDSVEPKKAGRPKMTDEQKAAAKAAREAKKAAAVAAEPAPKKAATPTAPKKAPKVAWSEPVDDAETRALLEEMDATIAAVN